ncbi:Histone transcription regulator 3 [Apophysomyces ossiformis]|uniref:Histone transcription regulator 3 n=1 Tax=Apophysomyces ossiformis TaxID=679940 RepID=A0A8H7BSJ6_9FUNG|nr:Histone transcription regulator 3 [Apophysomyces ossiformis]
MLRFLVFKNYASILEDEYETSDSNNVDLAKEALRYYLQALKIDPTEYSLWYRAGRIAQALGNNRFAQHAYQTGFFMNGSHGQNTESGAASHINWEQKMESIFRCGRVNPIQWQCMEGLCNVLFEIGDFNACKFYVEHGLKHFQGWALGKKLMQDMETPTFIETMDSNSDVDSIKEKKAYMPIDIQNLTWHDLTKSLLDRFNGMTIENVPEKTSVDGPTGKEGIYERTPFISKCVRINVTQPETSMATQSGPPGEALPGQATAETSSVSALEGEKTEYEEKISTSVIVIDEDEHVDETPKGLAGDSSSHMDIDHPLKRKRSEDEGEEGNAEDNEAEEKRASLRASKRQKEKVETEETWRRKMLEEEEELSDKVQNLVDKLSSVSYLQRQTPWYAPVEGLGSDTIVGLFWEWFDAKVSELDRSYTWNIGKFQLLDVLSNDNNTHQRRRYAIFEKSKAPPSLGSDELMNSSVLAFVESLNVNNSGIVDSLCQLAMVLLQYDNQTGLDESTAEIMVDAIVSLEHNFFNMLAQDALNERTNSCKTELVLRVCERLMDKAIKTIIVSESKLEHKPHTSSKKRSTSQSKQLKEPDLIAADIELCQSWIALFERVMAYRAIDEFKTASVDAKQDKAEIQRNKHMLLRYWHLRGKMAQCNEDIQDAYEWYTRCEQALKETEEEGNGDLVSLQTNCIYDSIISRERISHKLDILKIGNQAVHARAQLVAKDYQGVIDSLEEVVGAQSKLDGLSSSTELYETLAMLAEAYANTGNNLKAWSYYSSMLCRSTTDFVLYGCSQMKDKMTLRRDEDQEFFTYLKTIDMLLGRLIHLGSATNTQEWFPQSFEKSFFDSLFILLRTSFIYIFRHPDFVPLVNNFPVQDNPPHVPSLKTKAGAFSAITAKIWAVQSMLIRWTIMQNPSIEAETLPALVEVLLATHEELGEREICGSAKGTFIKQLLELLIGTKDIEYRRSIYQCYHCLYGVHVAAEGDPIEEHHSTHNDLTEKAAEELFGLVADIIVEKVDRGSQLRSDLKDIVDTASQLFEKLPTDNHRVKFNQNNIDTYLKKDICIPDNMNHLQGTAHISTMEIDPIKSDMSPVYFKIFWARGKMLRLQIKNRTKLNPERTIEDLEEAIGELTGHLILNPNDIRGWYELGLSFMQIAEEELIWSASNITLRKGKIADFQKKGYHALLRAWALTRTSNEKLDDETMFDLLNNFGYLIYSIVCRPMGMEALVMQSDQRAMGKDGKIYNIQPKQVDPKVVYRLALMMFTNALRYKCPDSLEWQPLYMSGKCYSKLLRPPREVLEWYQRAIQKAPLRSGQHGQEKILEPLYKLCSALPAVVSEFLKDESEDNQQANTSTIDVPHPLNISSVSTFSIQPYSNQIYNTTGDTMQDKERQYPHLSAEEEKAYEIIFKKLSEIRKVDKKKWHHRPIYLHAWMYYYVYKNPEKAKAELSQFFTLKTNTKSPISIWKPDFERPGKHFEYVYKYTTFLVELAEANDDVETLKQLCRKARRAQTVLLRDDKVFSAAYTAYLQIVQRQLLSRHHAESCVERLLNKSVDKERFEELCREHAESVTKTSPKPEIANLLHDLIDIRRISHGQKSSVNMDDVVVQCYAVLLQDNGKLEQCYVKDDDRMEIEMENQSAADRNEVKVTREMLIDQAKALYSAY